MSKKPKKKKRKPSKPGLKQIHYYNVSGSENGADDAWVHYTSRVPGYIGTDMRVADVVGSINDVSDLTMGIMRTGPGGKPTPPFSSRLQKQAIAEEAVRVAAAADEWLNRIMTGSPLRDGAAWRLERREQYLNHLGEPGQSEMVLRGMGATLHCLKWLDELYVSDQPFYPYPKE
jgi:hypothetical protein